LSITARETPAAAASLPMADRKGVEIAAAWRGVRRRREQQRANQDRERSCGHVEPYSTRPKLLGQARLAHADGETVGIFVL
jgi:hypothetical protein